MVAARFPKLPKLDESIFTAGHTDRPHERVKHVPLLWGDLWGSRGRLRRMPRTAFLGQRRQRRKSIRPCLHGSPRENCGRTNPARAYPMHLQISRWKTFLNTSSIRDLSRRHPLSAQSTPRLVKAAFPFDAGSANFMCVCSSSEVYRRRRQVGRGAGGLLEPVLEPTI